MRNPIILETSKPQQSSLYWNDMRIKNVLSSIINLFLVIIIFYSFFFNSKTSFAASDAVSDNDSPEQYSKRIETSASIGDLVAYAVRENPKISEARETWKATIEGRRIATGLPDPQLMFTYYPDPIETRLGPQDWNTTLSQVIPYPGKLVKSGVIVDKDSEIARLNLDKTIRDISIKIKESFHELAYIREAKRVAAQNMKLLNHLRSVGEAVYAQDQAALIDIVKAQSQEGQLQYDALLLEELEFTEITNLNSILNRPSHYKIGKLIMPTIKPIAYSLSELYKLAQINQEEIRIKDISVDKADIKVDLAKDQRLPDFKVGIFYAGIGNPDVPVKPPDAKDDAFGVQFGITVPIWFGKNNSRVSKALAEKARAIAAKRTQINDTNSDIHSIYFRLQNSLRLITLYRDNLLPQAASSLEIAENMFRQQQAGFSDFIEAQSSFYNFNLAIARATADYGKYLARLERLIGHSLTERKPLEEFNQEELK